MAIDQREEFFGTDPAPHRAEVKLRHELRFVAIGAVFLLGFLFFLSDFAYGKEWQYYAYLIASLLIGAAGVIAGLAGAYRQSQRLAVLKAQPPGDVLWYVLDDKGLHICNTMEHTPSGRALVPWTEMNSVELIDTTEPVARLTCRGSSGEPSSLDLMASFARRDGARFGDRLKARFDHKGRADDANISVQDETISAEEIARLKRLLAEARRPREPVFGPDGGPVAAPPPPDYPDKPPTRDDRPELPPERWRTVP